MLADYVDAGGRVILVNFSFYSGWAIQGRIITDGYSPLIPSAGGFSCSYLGTYDSGHPIMQGISAGSTGDYYRPTTAVDPGATLVASWQNGYPYVASKGCLVGLNSYPGWDYDLCETSATTMGLLYHNAIVRLMEGCSTSPTYDLNFHDQYDRSELCLASTTGDYVYNILSGPHMGESFTGVATIVNYGPTYFLFRSACPYGSPYCLMGNWDSNRLKAAASLRVNSPTRYYSNLYDPNYADSLPCGTPAR